jgi:hypothetical protein
MDDCIGDCGLHWRLWIGLAIVDWIGDCGLDLVIVDWICGLDFGD